MQKFRFLQYELHNCFHYIYILPCRKLPIAWVVAAAPNGGLLTLAEMCDLCSFIHFCHRIDGLATKSIKIWLCNVCVECGEQQGGRTAGQPSREWVLFR